MIVIYKQSLQKRTLEKLKFIQSKKDIVEFYLLIIKFIIFAPSKFFYYPNFEIFLD